MIDDHHRELNHNEIVVAQCISDAQLEKKSCRLLCVSDKKNYALTSVGRQEGVSNSSSKRFR